MSSRSTNIKYWVILKNADGEGHSDEIYFDTEKQRSEYLNENIHWISNGETE